MEDLERFVERLRDLSMGLILDVVPNHMCVADLANAQWFDVLENGPSSQQAKFFDIDWNPPREGMANKVLLPILGDQYGRVLEDQHIRLEYSGDAFLARYYETALPIAPRSWTRILRPVADYVRQRLGDADQNLFELESIITALGYLPRRSETDQDRIKERHREKEIIKRRLFGLNGKCQEVADGITAALHMLNGVAGDPSSFDSLEQLLSEQAYRLSFWRVAADEINYRRFFDINELAAIRTEDPAVFEATHRLIFDLIRKGWITGLRVDHPDGLFDPAKYFADLQTACSTNDSSPQRRFFVVAEKIVAGDERLRENWAVEGTTGYGYLNLLNGLFVFPGSKNSFQNLYARWTGWNTPVAELIYECKRLIMRASMSSELNVLARRLDRIWQLDRHSRDFTLESLRFALREVIACFPVYRTYITEQHDAPDEEDRRHTEKAIEEAKRRNPATNESVFDAIGSLLLLQNPAGITPEQQAERRLFVMRFQQLTGPVMAKGVEDTAFYRYYPLASLNEVGGDPDEFGVSPRSFHRKNLIRLQQWPRALLATSTHDTKRSEDVRARIDALSEIPLKWYEAVRLWSDLNAPGKSTVEGAETPDRNAEYLLYQSLLGIWPVKGLGAAEHPVFVRRIQDYINKALKEAKLHTSWIAPNEEYDQAIRNFVASILNRKEAITFLDSFESFAGPVIRAGMLNSLSQVLLKVTSPGIPDFYQGSETWDFSLVDPDNRRPVDFDRLRPELSAILESAGNDRLGLVADLMRTPEDGRIKLFVTSSALRYRRAHPALFETGSYHPVEATGKGKQHVVGFARKQGATVAIAVAGRFFLRLSSDAWKSTVLRLPKSAHAQEYVDVMTGRTLQTRHADGDLVISAEDVFRDLPVALLEATV